MSKLDKNLTQRVSSLEYDELAKSTQGTITVSELAERLLEGKVTEQKSYQKNILRLVQVLLQKQTYPKYIMNKVIPFLKMLNAAASHFAGTSDLDSSLDILDLCMRLSNSVLNQREGVIQQLTSMNNLAIVCIKQGNTTLAKSYLKMVRSRIQSMKGNSSDLDSLCTVILNNLCSIYIKEQKYEKVYQLSEEALIKIEQKVFSKIKELGEQEVKNEKKFIADLHLLLQGYIHRGQSQELIKNLDYTAYVSSTYRENGNNVEIDEDMEIRNEEVTNRQFTSSSQQKGTKDISDRSRIYKNGYKLSLLFLGKDHKTTRYFAFLLKEEQQLDLSLNKRFRINSMVITSAEYFKSPLETRLYVLQAQFFKEIQNQYQSTMIVESSADLPTDQVGTPSSKNTLKKQEFPLVDPSQSQISMQPRQLERNNSKNKKKIVYRNQTPNFSIQSQKLNGVVTQTSTSKRNLIPVTLKARAQSTHAIKSSSPKAVAQQQKEDNNQLQFNQSQSDTSEFQGQERSYEQIQQEEMSRHQRYTNQRPISSNSKQNGYAQSNDIGNSPNLNRQLSPPLPFQTVAEIQQNVIPLYQQQGFDIGGYEKMLMFQQMQQQLQYEQLQHQMLASQITSQLANLNQNLSMARQIPQPNMFGLFSNSFLPINGEVQNRQNGFQQNQEGQKQVQSANDPSFRPPGLPEVQSINNLMEETHRTITPIEGQRDQIEQSKKRTIQSDNQTPSIKDARSNSIKKGIESLPESQNQVQSINSVNIPLHLIDDKLGEQTRTKSQVSKVQNMRPRSEINQIGLLEKKQIEQTTKSIIPNSEQAQLLELSSPDNKNAILISQFPHNNANAIQSQSGTSRTQRKNVAQTDKEQQNNSQNNRTKNKMDENNNLTMNYPQNYQQQTPLPKQQDHSNQNIMPMNNQQQSQPLSLSAPSSALPKPSLPQQSTAMSSQIPQRQNSDYLSHINNEQLEQEESTVSKYMIFNSTVYFVKISVNKSLSETALDISGYSVSDNIPLQTQTLTLKVVKGVLNILNLTEGTPFNKPFKTVRNFKDMCQYLIYPFLVIETTERCFHIYRSLSNMIQYDHWSIDFMQQSCQVFFNHLNQREFKITLWSKEKELLRLDLEFDEQSMKQSFKKIEGKIEGNTKPNEEQNKVNTDNYERLEVKSIHSLVEQFDLEKMDPTKRQELLEQKQNQSNEFLIESYDIPNSVAFLQKIKDLLNLLSQFLTNLGYTSIDQYYEDHTIKVLRSTILEDFKKGSIYFAKETIQKTISVNIQNIHKTHAPEGALIKQSGSIQVEQSDFLKMFGVSYDQTDRDEKYYFLTLTALRYQLFTFSKPLEDDDIQLYKSNKVTTLLESFGGYERVFIGSKHVCPLTFQLWGFGEIAYGVKVTIGNLEELTEQGVFFIIDPINWIKVQKEGPVIKKRSTKYKSEFELIKNYELTNILDSVGYKLIENSIRVCFDTSRPLIVEKHLQSGIISNVERIDNVITFQATKDYLLSSSS